ncbi:hypothetical protein D3C80_1920460 [compost metagenome]
MLQNGFRPANIQISVLLSGKGGMRQVFSGCTGADGIGMFLPQHGDILSDSRGNVHRDVRSQNVPADFFADLSDLFPVCSRQ